MRNKTIIITRAEKKSREFAQQIKKVGGTPIIMPLLDFRPTALSFVDKQQFSRLDEYDWVIFTSVNGVEYFFWQAEQLNVHIDRLPCKIAVIGEKTKISLAKRGLNDHLLPERFVAEGLIDAFSNEPLAGKKILYVQGNLARELIPKKLRAQGAVVSKLTVYETVNPTALGEWKTIIKQDIDAITFTSPSTIKHFVELLEGENWQSWIENTIVCCLGPITEKTARSYGIVPNVVPHTYTMEHLLEALLTFFKKEEEL